jgi:hypothetical protein
LSGDGTGSFIPFSVTALLINFSGGQATEETGNFV